MRTPEDSSTRWEDTIKRVAESLDVKDLARLDKNGSTCSIGLRSVCWKIFLQFQSLQLSTWSAALKDSRGAYASLRERYLKYIDNPGELGSVVDPLDDDKNSPWNTLRRDEELRAEIQQDVERCMPDEDYFRQPQTQSMLLDILFIFCKLNPDTGYRQGMHELLAPVLWVIEEDSMIPIPTRTAGEVSESEVLKSEVLNAGFIEHDAFTLFTLIMRTAKSFYELSGSGDSDGTSGAGPNGSSQIVERSKRIHEDLLATFDSELASHLTAVDILPQIFLIRWIRLLFGREFAFASLLVLWDTVFAEDPALHLVDLICVAMLLRIRWQLIEADYSVALMLLLKYPTPELPNGPETFVQDAIFLKENPNAEAGAELIARYTGKRPLLNPEKSRASVPGRGMARHNREDSLSRQRSPLPSPARFMQQQGGVEAFLQGAARGVLARSEKLGINRAVREAVGEVKKNMQNLSQGPSSSRRSGDFSRWSLDDGQPVPSTSRSLAAMEYRNKQLAIMLEDALRGLRTLQAPEDSKEAKSFPETIDLAIAKIQFVQVYLEDPSMPIPTDQPQDSRSPLMGNSSPKRPSSASTGPKLETTKDVHPQNRPQVGSRTASSSQTKTLIETSATISTTQTPEKADSPHHRSTAETEKLESDVPVTKQTKEKPEKPPMAVPTRSSLAQSSFAFMLEHDEPSPSALRSASPKSSSPFLGSGRKGASSRREQTAFLFGEDPHDDETLPRERRGSSVQPDQDVLFNLTSMKSVGKE